MVAPKSVAFDPERRTLNWRIAKGSLDHLVGVQQEHWWNRLSKRAR
jgi:hypothetical protein